MASFGLPHWLMIAELAVVAGFADVLMTGKKPELKHLSMTQAILPATR